MIKLDDVDDTQRQQVCEIAAAEYSSATAADLAPVLDDLLALPTLRDLADYDGTHRSQAAAKRATSELTGRLSVAAVEATRTRFGSEPLYRYDAELIVPDLIAAECALLKAVAVRFVMRRFGIDDQQLGQRRLLTELVAAIVDGAPNTLDRGLAPMWRDAHCDQDRLRVVIDQVAQLTDSSAIAWHDRLVRPRS